MLSKLSFMKRLSIFVLRSPGPSNSLAIFVSEVIMQIFSKLIDLIHSFVAKLACAFSRVSLQLTTKP